MKRCLIHAHVYYEDLWPQLAQCIANFTPYGFDLCVTACNSDRRLESLVKKDFPQARFRALPNQGFDVGPFLETINDVDLGRYEYVVKLHTKRDVSYWVNFLPVFGSSWRDRLLSFCDTEKHLRLTMKAFDRHPELGMIAHPALIVSRGDRDEEEFVKRQAEAVVARAGFRPGPRRFVAGTMFMARASVCRALQGLNRIDDFAASAEHKTALAHVYERAFGYMMTAQGYKIGDSRGLTPFFDLTYFIRMPLFYVLRTTFRLVTFRRP